MLINSNVKDRDITRGNISDIYCVDTLDGDTFSPPYQMIETYQQKYKELVAKLKRTN